MIQTQISLTPTQARRLRRLADERHTSMAALVREAVDSAYPEPEARNRDKLWARAMSVVGIGNSGIADLGEEHDRYLAEIDW